MKQTGSFPTWAWALFLLPMLWSFYLCQTTLFAFDPEAAKEVYRSSWQLVWGEKESWYLWINLGSIFFPFVLSFDSKVHFYRKWKYLWPGLLAVGAFFLLWDLYFTYLGVWGFNPRYTSHYFLGLPLGEWLFFLCIPYCCVFLYECLRSYIPKDPLAAWDKPLSYALIGLSLFLGFWHIDKAYTSWTFLLLALLLILHYRYVANSYRTWFYLSFLVAVLPFSLVNGALTGMFNEEPVVLYNNAHNLQDWLGTRFFSIPYDDFGYGFLLLFLNVISYEYFRQRA